MSPPDDLAFLPEDPFHACAPPADGNAFFVSKPLPEVRLYYTRLFRTVSLETSETAAINLGTRLRGENYRGFVLDYRGASIEHPPAGFRAVAAAFANALPLELAMVYLHDRATQRHARLMRRLLAAEGMRVSTASSWERALASALNLKPRR